MGPRAVIGVLGTVGILAPAPLTIRSVRKRAVLAGLALGNGREVSVDRLIDLVWNDSPPRTAQHALQVYVSELRAQLGPAGTGLVTTSGGYRLDLDVVTTDVAIVDELAGAGRAAAIAGRPDEAAEMFTKAFSRWRGEPYHGIDDVDEVRAERARLDALRAGLRDELADAYLALGRHAELIPQLESRVLTEPLRERPYEQLMIALYRTGRQSDALRVYQRAREVLIDQVGVEPGHRLRELEAAVLEHDAELTFHGGATDRNHQPAGQPRDRRPFVGRAQELDAMAEIARQIEQHGACRFVLVGGNPGIGKTRLVEEFTSHLAGEGWTILRGRCPDERGAPPLWPLADAVRPLGTLPTGSNDALTAPLRRLLGELTDPPAGRIDEGSSFALHDAVAELVLSVTTDRTALVLDDAHWADEATLGTVVRMAQRASHVPLLVVMTHRSAALDRSDAFNAAAARLVREPVVTSLVIGPLDERAEAAYLESIGFNPAGDEVAWIRKRSDGNPLFLTELALLVQAGGAASQMPVGLHHVLAARLALLGAHADVLSRAAIVGREFDIGVVARLGFDSAEAISAALASGARAGVIEQRSPGLWRFSHVLVAEAAVARLDEDERRRLHLRAAEVIDTSPAGDRSRRGAEGARHRIAALPLGDPALAAEASLRSGNDALASYAYDDAAQAFSAARSALAHGAPEAALRARALVGEAEALTVAGDGESARPLIDEALELIDRDRDPLLFGLAARVLVLHRSAAGAAGNEQLASLLRDAIAALGRSGGWLAVQLRTDLAMLHYRTDAIGLSESLAREALTIARNDHDTLATSFALTGLHQAIWSPTTLDERIDLASEAIGTAQLVGLCWHESMATAFRAIDSWERGDFGAVERDLAIAIELAERGRRPRFVWIARSWSALLDLYRGDVDGAEAGFAEALAAWGPTPNPDALQCFFAQQLMLRLLDGRAAEIIDILREVAATDPDRTLWRALLSYPLTLAGAADEAHHALDEVMDVGVGALRHDVTQHVALAMLSEAAGSLHRPDVAAAVITLLEPYAGRRIVTNVYGGGGLCWGSVTHQLGVCAATLGDCDRARSWFGEALVHHGDDGAPWFEERTRASLASLPR